MSETPVGPVMVRRNELRNIGDRVPPHTHNFDHATRGCDGLMRLCLTYPGTPSRDQTILLKPGMWVNIPAEALHECTALEPNSAFECIFPHHDKYGKLVDHYADHPPAYY